MNPSKTDHNARFYAQTYDLSVPDWPGELEFYCQLAEEAKVQDQAVLEVACGTGRIAIRLAQDGVFEPAERFHHPQTGRPIHTSRAWSYEPATQTAIVQTVWEEIDEEGQVLERWETGPVRLHCAFRFEMEHVLRRAGFQVEALYGDFYRQKLHGNSSEMIWVAKRPTRKDSNPR